MEEGTSQSNNKKSENSKAQPAQASSFIFIAFVSLLAGFMGGFAAIRFSPNLIHSNAETTKQVVETEGELIADIAADVGSSVVSIEVTSVTTRFNPFSGRSQSEQNSAGSGIIISSEGLVLTNKHVVPEESSSVSIRLSDGTVYDEVDIIGRDSFSDIAYLKIKNAENLKPAKIGDSDTVRVGQRVIAIGNALGEFDTTVTSGIISGLGRPIIAGTGSDSEPLSNLFQTDASINPGNSGGPLLNLNGEVIGVTTAVAGDAENIGFAIPVNDIKPGISSVEESGELIRPYLGVVYVNVTKQIAEELNLKTDKGALIYASGSGDSAIVKDSPADKAGLKEDDVILKVNNDEVTESKPLSNLIGKYQVGDEVTLHILRGDETNDVKVKLERVPEDL